MKTLGKISAKLITQLYDENKAFFGISDVSEILNKEYNEVTDLLSRLVKRKVITRIKAGKFMIIPQELGSVESYVGNLYLIAREIVNSKDYYIAFYSAMKYWGMLTQPLIKVFVATPKRQVVPKDIKDKLVFVYVKKENIWGIKEEWTANNEKIRISDPEKTVIDALDHPEYCGGITEIAKGIWMVKDKLDYEKLLKYIKINDQNAAAKRLGYIMEIINIGKKEFIEELRKYIKERYDIFDSTLPAKRIDKNSWRLIDNVGKKEVTSLIWH